MKTHRYVLLALMLFSILVLSACSGQAPRINPGKLEISESVTIHKGKITNIVQLSEREAPPEKMLAGVISGAVIGHAISDNGSDDVQELMTAVGAIIGKHIVMNEYGRTIYRLQLRLDDVTIKQVHVRGGSYGIGKPPKLP